jgi:hypothetical protein
MACPVSTAALTGAQAATLRSHWKVARRSGQRQVGHPSVLNETPPIPGRWYLQTRVFSRVPPVCADLCVSPVRNGERRLQVIYPSSCARLGEREPLRKSSIIHLGPPLTSLLFASCRRRLSNQTNNPGTQSCGCSLCFAAVGCWQSFLA